jgi:retron-type reverse transcriptase
MNRKHLPFDLICDPEFLMIAWKQVRANRGAPGVDQVTIAQFERELPRNLQGLAGRLREGRYYPMPARTFEMKKANGGVRTLAILTVEDRIVQRAALNALEPLFEPAFADCSFGFRPQRNVQMAVERALSFRAGGDLYVVKSDVSDLFGSLDHDLLMRLATTRVRDQRMLGLIRMWLDCEQALPRPVAEASTTPGVIERLGDYATGAINSAVTHLLDEGAGYGRYPNYPPGQFYGAAEVYAPDSRDHEEAMSELRRRARIEALKRLGTDGALLLLTSAARARKLITPTTLAVGSLAALAAAAYPKAAQMWRERAAAHDSGVGAMQGGSLSPLLANIYLNEFDLAMGRAGWHLARYADDFIIATRDEQSAMAALETAACELGKLKLRLNTAKTSVKRFDQGVEWLGYSFHPHLLAAAPAPPDDRASLAEWRRQAKDAVIRVAEQAAPAAARFGEGAKQKVNAGLARLKSVVQRVRNAPVRYRER